VVNIRKAYEIAEGYGEYWSANIKSKNLPHLILEEEIFTGLHEKITQGLRHADNIPGRYQIGTPKWVTRRTAAFIHHPNVWMTSKC